MLNSGLRIAIALVTVALGIAGFAAACGPANAAPVEQIKSVEYEVAPGARVLVDVQNSEVRLQQSDSASLKIETLLRRPNDTSYFVLPKGSSEITEVAVSLKPAKAGGTTSGAEITIKAPSTVQMTIRTTNRPVIAENVKIDEAGLMTTNSPVSVKGSQGNFTANTTEGKIEVSDSVGTFWMQTTNAPIDFRGEILADRWSRFITSKGTITVQMTGRPDLVVQMKALNGQINTPEISTSHVAGGFTTATLGSGLGRLEVQSDDGDINISLVTG